MLQETLSVHHKVLNSIHARRFNGTLDNLSGENGDCQSIGVLVAPVENGTWDRLSILLFRMPTFVLLRRSIERGREQSIIAETLRIMFKKTRCFHSFIMSGDDFN